MPWLGRKKNILKIRFQYLIEATIIYLQPAFDQIEGSDHGVGDTTREETTEAAVGVVGAAAELARVLIGGGCSEFPAATYMRKMKTNIKSLSFDYFH